MSDQHPRCRACLHCDPHDSPRLSPGLPSCGSDLLGQMYCECETYEPETEGGRSDLVMHISGAGPSYRVAWGAGDIQRGLWSGPRTGVDDAAGVALKRMLKEVR